MTAYDRAEHEAYTAGLEEMFGGRNHPEPDLTRAWIDMRSALPRGLARRVRRWLAAASLHQRPGRYVLTRAAPGALWCNSDPVVMAVGRALEPEVSRLIGRRAWLSFGGIHVHYRGVPTVRHRDFGYYRFLVAWPLLCDVDPGWPIYLERPGQDGGVEVEAFDNSSPDRALLFAGCDVQHWREPYPGERAVSFFMRYTALEAVRNHTQAEIDTLADAGLAELAGAPLDGAAMSLIIPHCTSQRLVAPTRPHFLFPGLFSPEECDGARHCGRRREWPEWLTYRLRRVVSDSGPGLLAPCAFSGHEHRLAIGLSRGGAAATWYADVAAHEAVRARVVLCLGGDGFDGIAFRDTGHVRMRPGDVLIFRADAAYRWPPSAPQLTALYGWPADMLARVNGRA